MTWWDSVVIVASGIVAGAINAVAGGGTLVSFPALIALGVPPLSANITNTVALVPGYLGGAAAQRRDLASYIRRLPVLCAVAAGGGLLGSVLLVNSPEELFEDLVPVLILTACGLLGFQDAIRRRVQARDRRSAEARPEFEPQPPRTGRPSVALGLLVAPAAVYGGYFGAGLGIMLLAVLGMAVDDPLPRLNALKSTLSLVINLVAAMFFVTSDFVRWDYAALLAVSSVVGGTAGGRFAGRLKPQVLRGVAITIGVVVAARAAFS